MTKTCWQSAYTHILKHLLICALMGALLWGFGISFCLNLSDSLAQRFFVLKLRPHKIERGSYVVFEKTVFGSKAMLIKQVLGLCGDFIQVESNNVWLNMEFVGVAKIQSKTGLPLHPIKIRVVPQNHFFVAGTHEDSFDSRYEEFGLVPMGSIVARAYPLF